MGRLLRSGKGTRSGMPGSLAPSLGTFPVRQRAVGLVLEPGRSPSAAPAPGKGSVPRRNERSSQLRDQSSPLCKIEFTMQGSQWYRKVGRIFFSNHNPLKDIYYAFEKKRVVNQCLRSFSGCKLKFGGTHAGCERVGQDEQCRLPPAGAPQASLRSRLPATPQPECRRVGKAGAGPAEPTRS